MLLMLMVTSNAWAMGNKPKNNTDKYLACLNTVNTVTCDFRKYDFSKQADWDAYYACQVPKCLKCATDNNISTHNICQAAPYGAL